MFNVHYDVKMDDNYNNLLHCETSPIINLHEDDVSGRKKKDLNRMLEEQQRAGLLILIPLHEVVILFIS